MRDLISRQQAIDAIVAETIYTKEELKEYYEANSHRNEWVNGIYDAVEAIKQLPPIQPVNCSEFPNNSDVVDRQKAKNAICNACGKIDCDEMDTCEKLDIPSEGSKLLQPWEVLAAQAVLPQSAEPKRGKWILDRSGAYCCSECMEPCAGYVMMKPRDKFCKMCGSRNEVME